MEFKDFTEIKELVQETEKLFAEVDKNIKELSEKQYELEERLEAYNAESVEGITQSAKDKDMYKHITEAKEKLIEKRKQLKYQGSKKRADAIRNSMKKYQNNVLNKTILNSPEMDRVKELWQELLDIDDKAHNQAIQKNNEMIKEAKKIFSKGYLPNEVANRSDIAIAHYYEPVSYSKEIFYALRAGKAPFEGK